MPKGSSNSARPEADVFAELKTLCTSAGYIHAIAYFCWRDNLIRHSGPQVVAKDLEHLHSHDRLLRTEIATLIGLMVQKPFDLLLPKPADMQAYIAGTDALLQELHRALGPHLLWGDLCAGKAPEHNPFADAMAMREPIFYSGESAYNFQYRDLARLKYRMDDEWLEANKGFRIDEACQIADALGKIHSERQLDCARSLRKQPPDQWTMLPGFMFTTQDVVGACRTGPERVEHFLDAFSCEPHERNTSFTALNEFNATNATPILKIEHGLYVLLQHYSLLEAIYETPFFWMIADEDYSKTALTNRGCFTEGFAANRLEAVFGASRVLRNVDIYKGKNRFAEADALVLYGDRAIVVQAKSKRLTIEARKGNDTKLKDDFKKAIQSAHDQAQLCTEALMGNGFKFVASSGAEVAINHRPRIIFPICIVSDHYPALGFQARQFLKPTATISTQPPLVTDIFALDTITEMLKTPLHLLNYLALRARFCDRIIVSHELTILGFHLKHNLWLDTQYDMVNLGDDFASDLDIAMMARRDGVPGEKTPKGILTRFENLTVGRLLAEIEDAASPQLTGLGLLLLQLSSKTAKFLSAGIDRIVRESRRDGEIHDISIPATGGAGLTIHCNPLPGDISRERLSAHCKIRKYSEKAPVWYGLLLDPVTGGPRGALVLEGDWKPDPQMDAIMSVWPKRSPIPVDQLASKPGKISRNAQCACGSGRKYKKCCLKA